MNKQTLLGIGVGVGMAGCLVAGIAIGKETSVKQDTIDSLFKLIRDGLEPVVIVKDPETNLMFEITAECMGD